MASWVSIDTGRNIGLAHWRYGDLLGTRVFEPRRSLRWEDAIKDGLGWLLKTLTEMIKHGGAINQAVLEYPEYFGSEGGRVSAEEGSLVKLAWAGGAQMAVCRELCISTVLVAVREWKGQMDKPTVERRIRRRLPESVLVGVKTHAWDAVGIGLYQLGQL